MQRTEDVLVKTDIGIVVLDGSGVLGSGQTWNDVDGDTLQDERNWIRLLEEKKIPVIIAVNKMDLLGDAGDSAEKIVKDAVGQEGSNYPVIAVSAESKSGLEELRKAIQQSVPEDLMRERILGTLVKQDDLVLLVMPQDIQAPKGRLILPQVQTIRELLDKKCLVMSVTTDKLEAVLKVLNEPPKLIITDSQVFGYVYEHKPAESMLTSFSVLFAAYKGDLPYYVEGAKQIDALTANSKVLIAECCTHAPLSEDIGRVKIPRMLKKRFGETLTVYIVSGMDFPQDLSNYDLIIQCGACMFNRKYVMSRIDRAREQEIPMTNYGVTIAHLTGILDKITMP